MKLGIVGGGVVGHATARVFMEFHEVQVYDMVRERATHSLDQVLACDLVFVCLPTPANANGSCNLIALHEFFDFAPVGPEYVLRSTVPPGTTRKMREYGLDIVHSPEFLTARCAVTDAHLPARNIIGGYCPLLEELYLSRFPGVPLHVMEPDESEAVKLICNAFFATKVAFFNEVHALMTDAVRNAVLADGRIAHSHTQVPGPDGLMGFGGACLPKDTKSLASILKAPLLEAALKYAR